MPDKKDIPEPNKQPTPPTPERKEQPSQEPPRFTGSPPSSEPPKPPKK